MQVKPPIGFGTIILGFAGICNLVGGFYLVVYPPSISLGSAYASYQPPPTYPGIAAMIIGVALLVVATIVYARRISRPASQTESLNRTAPT